MAKVEVVNRQVIDGKEYKRGQVITVSDGRARDLINAGKVRIPTRSAAKPAEEPDTKEGAKPSNARGARAAEKPQSSRASVPESKPEEAKNV